MNWDGSFGIGVIFRKNIIITVRIMCEDDAISEMRAVAARFRHV